MLPIILLLKYLLTLGLNKSNNGPSNIQRWLNNYMLPLIVIVDHRLILHNILSC